MWPQHDSGTQNTTHINSGGGNKSIKTTNITKSEACGHMSLLEKGVKVVVTEYDYEGTEEAQSLA